ncbi:MAG: DUF554 family protein [Verrucomicrobiae bacterium]|nr:DUF554 family protein [Verrucomicrobiae bacterium]
MVAVRQYHSGFIIYLAPLPRHNHPVYGAYLNALGIFVGALFGLAGTTPISARAQQFFKSVLGLFTALYGLRLIYENLHGPFMAGLRQLLIAIVAVVLGNWLGRLLRLQKLSNRIGHHAAGFLHAAQKNPPGRPVDGFLSATILFCAAPLGILGAVADGLADGPLGYFYLLLLKGVMDGLAMVTFVKLFRWPAALSAIPVFLFLNGLAYTLHLGLKPWLDAHSLTSAINLATGFITCMITLVILEIRKVELNSYLPAIFLAPLLKFWLG